MTEHTGPGDAERAAIRTKLTEMIATQERLVVVGERIVTMLLVLNEKTDLIIEAATKVPGPSPVAGVLKTILATLEAQQETLKALPAELAAAITEAESDTIEPADDVAWHEPQSEH